MDDLACVWHGGLTQPDTTTRGELLEREVLPGVYREERIAEVYDRAALVWTREDELTKPCRAYDSSRDRRRHVWKRAYDAELAARKRDLVAARESRPSGPDGDHGSGG